MNPVHVAIGVGGGWLILNFIARGYVDSRLYSKALASNNPDDVKKILAYFDAKGDKVKAAVLKVHLETLTD